MAKPPEKKDKKTRPPSGRATTPSADGERIAIAGYGNQFDSAALLLFDALADASLSWIGVGYRSAGNADDIVIGRLGRVSGYQFKSSKYPAPFTLKTLLLGANGLWKPLVGAWRSLRAEHPGQTIDIHLHTSDVPSTTDTVGTGGKAHSAAFLEEFQNKRHRTLAEWALTPWGGFVASLHVASELSPEQFEAFLSAFHVVPGMPVAQDTIARLPESQRKQVNVIADALPRLVRHVSGRETWPRALFLEQIGWTDVHSTIHSHQFPVGPFVQRNEHTERLLLAAIQSADSGYIALIGPPGVGKSTILQTSIASAPNMRVARYLAYVPGGGQGLGRAEADDFLADIVASLKLTGLYTRQIHDSSLAERRRHFASLLQAASERYKREGIRTLIVVDGLDHIPREERPVHSLLAELPNPQSVPSGVIFVLGTQRLDLANMPPSVREQSDHPSRKVGVQPLTLESVCRIADQLGLAPDVDRTKVFELTRGHPLVTRYLVEALKSAGPQAKKELLAGALQFDGDIESVYKAAWRDVEHDEAACEVLAYIARSEAPLPPDLLVERLSEKAIEAALKACGHLMKMSAEGWSVFHNSFRLFVIGKPKLRFGRPMESYSDSIYRDLAQLAKSRTASAAQRWLELRYLARARKYKGVLPLATSVAFRRQLLDGRSESEIFLDSRLALEAAKHAGDTTDVVRVLFARDEISRRCQAFSYAQDLPAAYLAVGDIETALQFVKSYPEKAFLVVDELVNLGDIDRARSLFEKCDPVAKHLAGEYENSSGDSIFRDAKDWVKRAILFRDIDQLNVAIRTIGSAVVGRNHGDEADAESYCRSLRYIAAAQLLTQNPGTDVDALLQNLQLNGEEHVHLLLKSGFALERRGVLDRAFSRFEEARSHSSYPTVGSDVRRRLVTCAMRHKRIAMANEIFAKLEAPFFSQRDAEDDSLDYDGDARELISHSTLATALGVPLQADLGRNGGAADVLNGHLVALGVLRAKTEFGTGRITEGEVPALAASVLGFFCRYRPSRSIGIGRELYVAAPAVVDILFQSASSCGSNELQSLIRSFDKVVDVAGGWDARSGGLLQRLVIEGARQIHRFCNDQSDVLRRLESIIPLLHEETPEAQLDAYAMLATAFASTGHPHRGKQLLDRAASEGFGNALPPKKDPQYALWVDLLNVACEADPARRLDRVRFLARQLSGMSKTEGDATADRIAPDLIQEAAQVDPRVGLDVAKWINQHGQIQWPNLVNALLIGIVKSKPELVEACVNAWCSLSLPFYIEPYYRDSSIGDFPALAIKVGGERALKIATHLRKHIEIYSQANERVALLECVDSSLRKCCLVDPLVGLAIEREKKQAPEARSSYTPGRYDANMSLHEFASTLQSEEAAPNYDAPYAFERLIRTAGYEEARDIFDSWQVLQESPTSLFALVDYAFDEGRTDQAAELTNMYRPREGADRSWTRSFGGHSRKFFSARLRLHGESVHKEAFVDFIDSLLAGNENYGYMLLDLADILKVLAKSPDWPEIWSCLEEQLYGTREYLLGQDIELVAGLGDGVDVLAALFRWAFSLSLPEIHSQAEIALRGLAEVPHGVDVLRVLVGELLAGDGDQPVIGIKVLHAEVGDHLRPFFADRLADLACSGDFAVAEIARDLATRWNIAIPKARQDLPLFYELDITSVPEHRGTGDGLLDPESGSVRIDDPLAWTTKGFGPFLQVLEDAGVPRKVVRERVGMLLSSWGGAEVFGANATRRLETELARLGMRITYTKPSAAATLRAFRYVAQELNAAGALPTQFVDLLRFLHDCPPSPDPCFAISPKPSYVERIAIGRSVRGDEETLAAWMEEGGADFRLMVDEDGLVIAETSEFELRDPIQALFRLERLRLLNRPGVEDRDLEGRWSELPTVRWDGRAIATSDACSSVLVRRYSASFISDRFSRSFAVCPNVCARVGWSVDPSDPMTYVDASGRVVARILHWRDAGPVDVRTWFVRGRGCLVTLSRVGVTQIEALLGEIDGMDIHVERACQMNRSSRAADMRHRYRSISVAPWKVS